MKLKNKVALITGGGRGLGRASAVAVAREGARVAVLSRTTSELEDTSRVIRKSGGEALVLTADVGDEEAVRSSVEKAVSTLGTIDILVNCAAVVGPAAPIHEVDPDEWDDTIRVNLGGVRQICQETIPHMIGAEGGRIINVTSGLADIVMPIFGAYSVSKAGLNHMTRIMAEELRGHGIQVNGLDPGVMDTRMQSDIRGLGPDVLGKPLYEQFLSFKEEGHLRPPEEVAELVVFLASENAVGITGEIGGAAEFRDYGFGLSAE